MLQPAQTHDGLKFDATTIQDVLYGYTSKTASYALNWIRSYGLQEGRDYWRYASKEVRSDGQPRSVRYQFSLPATATIINRSKNRKVKNWFNIQYKDLLEGGQPLAQPEPMPYYNHQLDPETNTHVSREEPYRNLRDRIGQPEAIEEEPTIIQEEQPVSTALQVFDFKGHPVRVLLSEENGKEWFVVKDVCERLGLAGTPSSNCLSINDSHRGIEIVNTPGGPQKMLCVDEAGLYQLVMCSRRVEALEFKEWVTAEVLPSIRRTGSYSVTQTPGLSDTAVQNILMVQQQGTLAVLARIEEYKHENQMAAAKAEDRFAGLVEAYQKTNDRLAGLVEKLTERPVAPQPEVKKPKLKIVYNMIRERFGSTLSGDKHKLIYAKTQEVAEKFNKPYAIGPVPGFLFRNVNQTTQGVFDYSIKELEGQLN